MIEGQATELQLCAHVHFMVFEKLGKPHFGMCISKYRGDNVSTREKSYIVHSHTHSIEVFVVI